MDAFTVILIVIAVVAAGFGILSLNKARAALDKASEAQKSKEAQEAKLNSLRQEVSSLKEDNQRKSKMLEEARENAKRKLRKDAQKADTDSSVEASTDSEEDRLKRTISAMERQIHSMKDESAQSAAAVKMSLEADHARELAKLNEAIESLEVQLEQAKGESNKRRQNLSKQLAAPVDLTQLPSEVVGELSRLFRKNEQHEKMHGILQGKFQLSQERYQELQRRYFAVCRELALVARPNSETTDEEAQKLAESVVQASDTLSAQNEATHEKAADDSSDAT